MLNLVVSSRRVTGALAVCIAFLLLAGSVGQIAHFVAGVSQENLLVALFNLNREGNAPTFFSVFLLFSAAQLLALLWFTARQHRFAWGVLCAGFVVMAIDEGWHFHERIGGVVRQWLGLRTDGLLHFAWVVPGIAAAVASGLFFVPLLRSVGSPGTELEFAL